MRPTSSFISQPVRSLQTMLRVVAEDDPSYPNVIPDGIYGPETAKAIGAFQRKNGLPVTGTTDQKTWEFIVDAFEEALIRTDKAQPIEALIKPGQIFRTGDADPYIYLAQAMLDQISERNVNIDYPNVTGVLDPLTARALSQFQEMNGLPITGELDRKTWKYLVLQFTREAHILGASNAVP